MKVSIRVLLVTIVILFVNGTIFANGKSEESVESEAVVEERAEKMTLRMSSSSSPTEVRAQAIENEFRMAISDFADLETHWNATLFKQGTELEAVARGNLELVYASAQEIAQFIPEFSIFSTGYVHRDAQHQIDVFKNELMNDFKRKAEEKINLKLLSVVYLGRRNLNLRGDKVIQIPEDLSDVKLRMPGTKSWQFLGKALGANPTPIAFTEVYTALQNGTVDGQDNPIPTTIDKKFYEVTDQVILTGHLVDLNYLAISVDVWNNLTPDQQKILQDAADRVSDMVWKKQSELEKEQISFLKEEGLKVYTPDLEAFRIRVQTEYLNSEYSEIWPPGVLDKINQL